MRNNCSYEVRPSPTGIHQCFPARVQTLTTCPHFPLPTWMFIHRFQMGDVANHREDSVRRCSSPKTVNAYRKRVRDRVQVERSRRRAARGLPLHRPSRIAAVTSRADLMGVTTKVSQSEERSEGGMKEQMLKQEPYIMLVHARNQQNADGSGKKGVVPFCSDCLGNCKGTCSPSGELRY